VPPAPHSRSSLACPEESSNSCPPRGNSRFADAPLSPPGTGPIRLRSPGTKFAFPLARRRLPARRPPGVHGGSRQRPGPLPGTHGRGRPRSKLPRGRYARPWPRWRGTMPVLWESHEAPATCHHSAPLCSDAACSSLPTPTFSGSPCSGRR
jgi:hypothetical protein